MMRKLLFVGVLVLAMSGLALAQDFPKFEIFGGYSYLRSDLNNNSPFVSEYYNGGVNNLGVGDLNGFEASFTYNLNRWLGIKADFGGHFGKNNLDYSYSLERQEDYDDYYTDTYNDSYEQKGKADVRHYTYLFGPEFSYRGNARVRPFAHALFGFSKVDVQKINVDYTESYGWSDSNEYLYEGNVTGSFSNTSFAVALGGGLDVNVNKKCAIRLAQIDYLPTYRELKGKTTDTYNQYENGVFQYNSIETETIKMPAARFNNLRLSAGVVFKF